MQTTLCTGLSCPQLEIKARSPLADPRGQTKYISPLFLFLFLTLNLLRGKAEVTSSQSDIFKTSH